MAHLLDPNKRRLEARQPLRDMGFTEQMIATMEEQAIKSVDRLVAHQVPPNMAYITTLMVLEHVAAMCQMTPRDQRDMEAKARQPARVMAQAHTQALELAKDLAWQSKARRVTDQQDAWTTLEHASELDVTGG